MGGVNHIWMETKLMKQKLNMVSYGEEACLHRKVLFANFILFNCA